MGRNRKDFETCIFDNGKKNIANASLIKYLGDNELQFELESIRKLRNNLAHNIHVSQKISLDKISTVEKMLNEYITKKLKQNHW